MNEDRRKILEMLSAGKITTDEAERLLAALDSGSGKGAGTTSPGSNSGSKSQPKYVRVMVEDHSDKDGKTPGKRVRTHAMKVQNDGAQVLIEVL